MQAALPILAICLLQGFLTHCASVGNSGPYFRMPYNNGNWEEIKKRLGELDQQIKSGSSPSKEVKYAIKKFDPAATDYNFEALYLVENDEGWKRRMEVLYPKMAKIALQLPQLLPNPGLPLLPNGQNKKVTLTQQQVLSLLAHSFFCTFPSRADSYPRNKFWTLFDGRTAQRMKAEKIKAFLHYFERMTASDRVSVPGSLITYERRVLSRNQVPKWEGSTKPLTNVHVEAEGLIEESKGKGHMQIDFANKYLGGGVLASGGTQEEIRFAINPELLVSTLITEVLEDNEAIIITGTEQFSKYKGYSGTFTFDGDFVDRTGLDSEGRRDTSILAIDAIKFKNREWEQYNKANVDRELLKSFTGFSSPDPKVIATGKWGAGAFGGDQEVKFLIQWISASEAGKELRYFTAGSQSHARDIQKVLNNLQRSGRVTVGNLYKVFGLYDKEVVEKRGTEGIFDFITTNKEARRVLGTAN